MSNKLFQTRLKKLRTDHNLSMAELAEKLDVTKSRVNMWENNGSVPRKEALLKLSQLFSVSTDYLLGNDEQEGLKPENQQLGYLQRNLEKLNEQDLQKAVNPKHMVPYGNGSQEEQDEMEYLKRTNPALYVAITSWN